MGKDKKIIICIDTNVYKEKKDITMKQFKKLILSSLMITTLSATIPLTISCKTPEKSIAYHIPSKLASSYTYEEAVAEATEYALVFDARHEEIKGENGILNTEAQKRDFKNARDWEARDSNNYYNFYRTSKTVQEYELLGYIISRPYARVIAEKDTTGHARVDLTEKTMIIISIFRGETGRLSLEEDHDKWQANEQKALNEKTLEYVTLWTNWALGKNETI